MWGRQVPWHVHVGLSPQGWLDAGLALPLGPAGPPRSLPVTGTPVGSACPHQGPWFLQLCTCHGLGWAGSGLNPHQPQEMFACSGIYSRSLWIKERMGIIFPVGRRAYFRHRSVAGQPSLGPSEPVWELTQDWGVSDGGAVLRQPRTRSLGRDLPTSSGIAQRVGGQPSFTTCSFSLCPSALPPPGPWGPHYSPL